MSQYLVSRITKEKKSQILKKQNNKCAKKPYSRIDGLQNYKCILWKNNGSGKFKKNDVVFVKIDGEILALCRSCYSELVNRDNDSSNTSDSDSATESCSYEEIRKVPVRGKSIAKGKAQQ